MLKGTIYMGVTMSNQEDNYVSIDLTDEISGVRFLRVKMDLKSAAKMILGSSYVDCEFELHSKHVGMTREIKSEMIPIPDWHPTEEIIAELLKPYEVDGWKGSAYDMKNSNNYIRQKDDSYVCKTSFTRFV